MGQVALTGRHWGQAGHSSGHTGVRFTMFTTDLRSLSAGSCRAALLIYVYRTSMRLNLQYGGRGRAHVLRMRGDQPITSGVM